LLPVPCARHFEDLGDEFFKLIPDIIQLYICLLMLDIDLTYHIFTDETLTRYLGLSAVHRGFRLGMFM